MLYTIRLGPFPELADAQRASEAIASAFGLSPSVVIGEAPKQEEP